MMKKIKKNLINYWKNKKNTKKYNFSIKSTKIWKITKIEVCKTLKTLNFKIKFLKFKSRVFSKQKKQNNLFNLNQKMLNSLISI